MAENEENANLIVSAVNEATQTLQEIQKGFEDFEGAAGSLGVTSVTLGNILSDVLKRAFEALKDMVRLGINEAIDAEQQQVKLTQAFRDEGEAASASVKSINDAANALGELIGMDNDAIVSTAGLMRQLTGLSAEMINKTLPAIGDLATMTGSYEGAGMLVARAINGQEMGLSRLGIKLDLTSDKAENLRIVTEALNEKFGGQAQAQLATTGGKLTELRVVFTDVAQAIGESIVQSGAFGFSLSVIVQLLKDVREMLGKKVHDPIVDIKTVDEAKTALEKYKGTYDMLVSAYKNNVDSEQSQKLMERIDLYDGYIVRLKRIIEGEKEKADTTKKSAGASIDDLNATIAALEEENKAIEENISFKEGLLTQSAERIKKDKEDAKAEQIDQDKLNLEEQLGLIQKFEDDKVQADFTANAIIQEQIQFTMGVIQYSFQSMGEGFSIVLQGMFTANKDVLGNLRNLWRVIITDLLAMLGQLLARMLMIKALMTIFNLAGGTGVIAEGALGLASMFSGQTPEGSSRLVPGPPNMPRLGIVHGGERVGRDGSGGGATIIIQGDYFESEEANARLFDRVRTYKKRSGVDL